MPSIPGIAFAIRRDFFNKIGGFDSNMQPYADYMIELSIRVCAKEFFILVKQSFVLLLLFNIK